MVKKIIAVALGVSAALLSACGGGESPQAPSAQAANETAAAAPRAAGSNYRVALPDGAQRNTLDKRLRGARGPIDVWVSL